MKISYIRHSRYHVPRILGLVFVFLLGIDAATAVSWGLVNRLAEAEHLTQLALDWAKAIAADAPLAQRGNKCVIDAVLAARGQLDPGTERALIELREACFRSEDFREGVRAFAEKRAPRWQGR